ncbi:MAG: LysR family transcriptional regulator [Pseudomonadota bacterium]
MIDHLRQMAIFAKTIEHGSFRAAAQALKLSPSVVSQHISQLEAQLGARLLHRSTRKLTLTTEGQKILEAAVKMLSAVQGDLTNVAQANVTGDLRITVPSVLSTSHLTHAIGVIAHKYPNVRLDLDYTDERKTLVADQFDLAVRMSLTKKQTETTHALFEVRRTLVASREYVAQFPTISGLDDLVDVQFLTLEQVNAGHIKLLHRDGRSASLRPDVCIQSNHAQGLYQMVRAGLGMAVLPAFLSSHDVQSGDVIHVLPDWQLAPAFVYLEWSGTAPPNSLARKIAHDICQVALPDIS